MTNDKEFKKLTADIPEALWDWLEAATRGVGRIGMARVIEDIAVHYKEMQCDAIELGQSESDAESTAIQSLGNPETARQKFRREHLTAPEESRLVDKYKRLAKNFGATRGQTIMVCIVMSGFIIYELAFEGGPLQKFDLFWWIPMLLPAIYLEGITEKWLLARKVRRTIYADCIMYSIMVGFFIMTGIFTQTQNGSTQSMMMLPFVLIFGAFALRDLRIAQKLPADLTPRETKLLLKKTEFVK
jgi:hypothetical protein